LEEVGDGGGVSDVSWDAENVTFGRYGENGGFGFIEGLGISAG